MEIFRSIDVNNRGFLTSADFRRLCLDLDIGLTSNQIVWAFGQLDTDNDGRITSDDFVRGHGAFTELFLASVTSPEVEEPRDVTGVTSEGGALAAWRSFLQRYYVEFSVLTSVRYIPYTLSFWLHIKLVISK